MALGSLTLLQIRTSSKQRADMVNSGFLTDAEWNFNINQSLYSLYDLLIQKFGDDYKVATPQSITTDGTNYLFALASDFYKALGVSLNVNGIYVPIKRFDFGLRQTNFANTGIPQSGLVVRVDYIPRMTELVSDSDIADGVSGWLEYVIVDCVIKALDKEESDVSVLMSQREAIEKRIEAAAENRDAGNPSTVMDVYAQGSSSPYGMSNIGCGNLVYRLSGNNIWLQNGSVVVNPGGFY